MKKRNTNIFMLTLLGLFMVFGVSAQNFQGMATYQSARSMKNFQFKAEGLSPDMQKQIQEKLKKQMQKEYELKFNLTESTWKEVESLDGGPASAVSGGGMVMTISSGGSSLLYKNTAEMKYLEETEVFSKPFLVDDTLETHEWQLTGDTKQIGNYQAQKAIFSRTRERQMMTFGDGEEGEMKTVTDTLEIEAWFTPQIPVSQGPDDYWGLPGLILEVTDGTTTYLCTKVVLNPEDGVEIKVPSKGKRVNREELKAITEEKSAEMMKKFSKGGKGTTFKIGG